MKNLLRTCVSIFVIASLSFCAGRICAAQTQQADLTGYWDLRTPNANGDGTFRDTYFGIVAQTQRYTTV